MSGRPKTLALTALLLALPTLAGAASEGTADWPSGRADAAGRAEAVLEAEKSGTPRAWTFSGSGRVYGYVPGMTVWSPPSIGVVGGRAVLFVGSYDKSVYALDAANGEELWRVVTGDGVYATPILSSVTSPSTVFVSSSDRLLYALDAETGAQRWNYAVADYRPTLGGARLASVCVGSVAGRAAVFLPFWVWDRSLAENLQESGIAALAVDDGSVLWRRRLGDNELTSATCFAKQGRGRVFAGSSDGNLFALDADSGTVLWQQTEVDAVRGAPAVVDSMTGPRLVLTSKAGLVRCLDAEHGQQLWQYRTGDWITSSPVIATVRERPLVFVGSYDRSLYALDLIRGTLVWRFHTPAAIHAPPAVVAHASPPLVLLSAWDHHLYGLGAEQGQERFRRYTGRPLWDAVGLEASSWSAPIAASLNGAWMAYVGSYDGNLYAFPFLSLLADQGQRPSRNFGFFLSFPIALTLVGLFARLLTVRHRIRVGRAAQKEVGPGDA